jgi:hypothetical protein
MTRMIIALVALLATGTNAAYTNATMPWTVDMDCTACIRSGFDYCINGTSKT